MSLRHPVKVEPGVTYLIGVYLGEAFCVALGTDPPPRIPTNLDSDLSATTFSVASEITSIRVLNKRCEGN
jgi:hypothetical protein